MAVFPIVRCYAILIFMTHVAIILLGAPLFDDIDRTFLFSLYLVTFAFTGIIVRCQGNLQNIYSNLIHDHDWNKLDCWIAWGTIVGAWLGAIPIPLDWDRWWQRWPLTCLFSSIIGFLSSLLVFHLTSSFRLTNKKRKALE